VSVKLLELLGDGFDRVRYTFDDLIDDPVGGVLVFLALIIGFTATVYASPAMFGGGYLMESRTEVDNLDRMVEQYTLMRHPPEAPETLARLTMGDTPITKKVPVDPWDNEYMYRKTGERDWVIFSCGPDGEPDTEDDITPER